MMRNGLVGIGGVAVLVAIGAGAYVLFGGAGGASDELAQRTRDGLVHIPGGTFEAGNFDVSVRLEGGGQEERSVSRPAEALPPYEVTLADFYLSDREATLDDLRQFASATGRPAPELGTTTEGAGGRAASMSWATATAYCNWLGDLAGLSMRLPTEAEWEYAARSGGARVPFATNDGSFRYGVNVAGADRDAPDPLPATLPPNPFGLFDMVAGAYEWVADTAPGDPADARIAKGSADSASVFFDPIPDRYVVEPLDPAGWAALGPFLESRGMTGSDYEPLGDGRMHPPAASVRCAATLEGPPEETGVGRAPANADFVAPDAFGPYDQMGNYLGE